jgi:hypothetical protein
MFGTYMSRAIIPSWCVIPITNMKWPLLRLLTNLHLKCSIRCKHSYSCLLLWSICLKVLFIPFHSKPMFVFGSEMCFL